MLRPVLAALAALAFATPSASASPVCVAAEADTTVTGPVSRCPVCTSYPGPVHCFTYSVYSGDERAEVVVCVPRLL